MDDGTNKIFCFFFFCYSLVAGLFYLGTDKSNKKAFAIKMGIMSAYIIYSFCMLNLIFGSFDVNSKLYSIGSKVLFYIYLLFTGLAGVSFLLSIAIARNLLQFIEKATPLNLVTYNRLNPYQRIREFYEKNSHVIGWGFMSILGFCAGFKFSAYFYFSFNLLTCLTVWYVKKEIDTPKIELANE